MTISVNAQRTYQYTPSSSHIITDETETMKLLEKKCGFVKPWSMDEKQVTDPGAVDKSKQAAAPKEYRKIDFYL